MTRLLFQWHIALLRLRYTNGRTTIAPTARAAENGPKAFDSVRSLRSGCATIGISPLSQHNVPRDFARSDKVREVEAESVQNPPNLENQCLH
jgi:hypothetical protein